jgi:hypothetical protein
MRRTIIIQTLILLASVEAASAQTFNQIGVVNYVITAIGGSNSSVGATQSGALNVVYAVQTANQSNNIVVNQQGIADLATVQQQTQNGLNNAYINQKASFNSADLTQLGRTNIAGIVQNSHVGGQGVGAPPLVLGGVPAPSNGPLFQSVQTADGGYLSLFETEGMSLATYTTGGMTVTSSFGRQH